MVTYVISKARWSTSRYKDATLFYEKVLQKPSEWSKKLLSWFGASTTHFSKGIVITKYLWRSTPQMLDSLGTLKAAQNILHLHWHTNIYSILFAFRSHLFCDHFCAFVEQCRLGLLDGWCMTSSTRNQNRKEIPQSVERYSPNLVYSEIWLELSWWQESFIVWKQVWCFYSFQY